MIARLDRQKIGRERLLRVGDDLVQPLADHRRLHARAELHGDGDGARSMELLAVTDSYETRVGGRRLVAALHVSNVAQMDRQAILARRDDGGEQLLDARDGALGIDEDGLLAGADRTAGEVRVPCAKRLRDLLRLDAERGQTLLGVLKVHLLGYDTVPLHARHLGHAHEPIAERAGVVVELPEAVFFVPGRGELGADLIERAHHDGLPHVGMGKLAPENVGTEVRDQLVERAVVARCVVDRDEARAPRDRRVLEHAARLAELHVAIDR